MFAQQYMSQDGHLLDANPRIGSMGINPDARLDALVPRLNNNLMITGNVSGGMRFQGLIPYSSELEFGATLGSSTLSDFRRDSVNLNLAQSGITGSVPYLDPARSVTGIRGQQVMSTAQRFFGADALGPSLGGRLQGPFDRNLTIRPMEQLNFSLNIDQPIRSVGPWPVGLPTGQRPLWMGLTEGQEGQSGPEQPERIQPLFPGESPYPPGQQVMPQDNRLQPLEPGEMESTEGQEPARSILSDTNAGQADRRPQEPLNIMGDAGTGLATPGSGQRAVGDTGTGQSGLPGMADPAAARVIPGLPAGVPMTVPGQTPAGASGLTRASPSEQAEPAPIGSLGRETGFGLEQYQQLARQRYQSYMQQARQRMQAGRFYQAANAYGSATVYAPQSAEAHLGKAYALFGAGEYMSAAYFLYRSLELNEKAALEPVDMTALMGTKELFNARMGELDIWQKQSGRAELMLLQGYILFQAGNPDTARALLESARKKQPQMKKIPALLQGMAAVKPKP
ncbi:MAG: tetratricopeptide repeat protein [Sedimentisphaerales bacterium]|nr:tetratricopeptide repeat protein [Sedimentisphaerales bacterium]